MAARKPAWLRAPLPAGDAARGTARTLAAAGLATVCVSARCPNRGECWSRRHCTMLILGDRCTRGCTFCGVARGTPAPPDPDEPARVARAARELGLREVVLTSVTRDDLPDGGAAHWAAVIAALRRELPAVPLEALIPDFGGREERLELIAAAAPDTLTHNLEMPAGLYPRLRPRSDYRRSLRVLASCAARGRRVKSGLMLGLGETAAELRAALTDLRDAGCRELTLGQYLQPARECAPVARYVPPGEFAEWRAAALALGFDAVTAGPLVRSSYRAAGRDRPVVLAGGVWHNTRN